jgi:hypothetical protein
MAVFIPLDLAAMFIGRSSDHDVTKDMSLLFSH